MIAYKKMGVINLTPNSFSDGGENLKIDALKKTFLEMDQWADIIDIGAESTAPFNEAIGFKEEIQRFEECFLQHLQDLTRPKAILSIDTYRPKTFLYIAERINGVWPGVQFIFNDVSGKVDEELLELLRVTDLEFSYVLSHNNAPTRAETSEHMDFIDLSSSWTKKMCSQMNQKLELLLKYDLNVILDPCFGFSKTKEQNLDLITRFSDFAAHIQGDDLLIGVSRKSFLRSSSLHLMGPSEQRAILDAVSAAVAAKMLGTPNKRFIVRGHSKYSFDVLDAILSLHILK